MLYDDDQGACITPEHVFETLEDDLEVKGTTALHGFRWLFGKVGSQEEEEKGLASVHAAENAGVNVVPVPAA